MKEIIFYIKMQRNMSITAYQFHMLLEYEKKNKISKKKIQYSPKIINKTNDSNLFIQKHHQPKCLSVNNSFAKSTSHKHNHIYSSDKKIFKSPNLSYKNNVKLIPLTNSYHFPSGNEKISNFKISASQLNDQKSLYKKKYNNYSQYNPNNAINRNHSSNSKNANFMNPSKPIKSIKSYTNPHKKLKNISEPNIHISKPDFNISSHKNNKKKSVSVKNDPYAFTNQELEDNLDSKKKNQDLKN